MNAIELNERLDRGEVLLLDVREPAEYRAEHISGAYLYPLSQLENLPIPPSDRPVAIHCQTGRRSRQAAHWLRQQGLAVVELEGGIDAWKKVGLRTEGSAVTAPISLMRQVQIVAGSLILLGVLIGTWVNPAGYGLSAFVGAGLIFAGVSGTCLLANLLEFLPWNRIGSAQNSRHRR